MAVLTNTMMQGTAAISDDGYQIEKSLRFNHSDSPDLRYVAGAAGNTKTWTFSAWMKRNIFGNDTGNVQTIFCAGDGSNGSKLEWSTDTLHWTTITSGSVVGATATNAVFRDPSAWYHVVMAYDSTQSIETERLKIYVNGVLQAQTTSNTIEQDQATHVNSTLTFILGGSPIHDGGRYCAMLISDAYLIDGLALSPAAFGSFDSTGAWNPKAFALPAPNNGTTWSDNVTCNATLPASGADSAAEGFDGDSGTAYPDVTRMNTFTSSSHLTVSFGTNGIPCSQAVEIPYTLGSGSIVANYDVTFKDGHVERRSIKGPSGSGASGTFTYNGRGSNVTEFKITPGSSSGNGLGFGHIKIDGVELVDGQTDVATRNNQNNGTTWSTYLTLSTGAWDGGDDPGSAFDGTISTAAENGTAYAELIFEPPGGIKYKKLEVQSGIGEFQLNSSGSWASTVNQNQWNTWHESTTEQTLTKFQYKSDAASGWGVIRAVKIDGHILIDSSVDNSFHLKFNDTSRNSALGKDSLNGKIEDATGGLPIYNTTDDYGDVKGSGYRADSSAGTTDGTGLVIAIPGDSITAASMDVHASINTGSSTNTMGDVSNCTLDTDDSRFYGKSIKFIGNGSTSRILTNANTDFQLGNGNFTTEFWLWSNHSGNHGHDCWVQFGGDDLEYEMLMLQINTGGGAVMHYNTSDGSSWDLAQGKQYGTQKYHQWTHYALVRNGTTMTGYENGISKFSYSIGTTTIYQNTNKIVLGTGQDGNWADGKLNDFRHYKGVAKYTANFKPPRMNDFTVNNLTHEAPVVPSAYMNSLIWTGNGNANQAQTGLGFSPDMVWIKQRNGSGWHQLCDRLRDFTDGSAGGSETEHALFPNSNNAASEQTGGIKSLDSAGFTIGEGGGVGASANEVVGWAFKAGGAGSANNTGSINATVSANDQGSFSIVKYTGNGTSGATVAHGLGKKPTMIVIKKVNDTGDWITYHKSTGAGKYNKLNTNSATITSAEHHKSEPTDTVFTIGDSDDVNESSDVFMAYCFADTDGLFATGIYTGNGAGGGGPVQTCGFKPHRIAIGPNSHDGNWGHWDLTRGEEERLTHGSGQMNDSGAVHLDMTNTGFKADNSDNDSNGNGRTYIWAAWAGDYNSGPDSIDSLTDSPTNYGTDAGAGGEVRGNYPTFNPLIAQPTGGSLSQGNLTISTTSDGEFKGFSTMAIPANTGKWYFEITVETKGNDAQHALFRTDLNTTGPGLMFRNGVSGDVFGYAIDQTDGTWTRYKNGSSDSSGTHDEEYDWLVRVYDYQSSAKHHINFGQRAFKHTAPAGYKCLCTQNLDDTFSGAELNNPSKYFDVKTWSGTGSAGHDIKGFNFQPDLVWLKRRDSAGGHHVRDAIRGATKSVFSNTNEAEGTDANIMSAFLSDGFTLGNGDNTNANNGTFVGWAWDAGTSTVSNTDGDITSSVRANPTSGVSVVSFTSNDTDNQTVGHGLNDAPKMIILKNRDSTESWWVIHVGVHATGPWNDHSVFLDTDAAAVGTWGTVNNVAPTNTVVNLSNSTNTAPNDDSDDKIMYCFAPINGFSKFGRYVGNGSTDGPFINLGFAPKYVLVKNVDSTGDWCITDWIRAGMNNNADALYANTNGAEGNPNVMDFLSNGFKIRTTQNNWNKSGDALIYAAFADLPFKTARAK